jgi:uncharacterized protein YndB with AHSA1/START domain
MTVKSVDTDYDNLTITLIAEFDAPVERVWQLWADPRQMERWWGPPTYPATVEEHDLTPGGRVTYYMTSPEDEKHRGWWRVESVDPPTSLEVTDGFADQDGNPVAEMPSATFRVELTQQGSTTRMEVRTIYKTREDLDKVVEMGMLEGIKLAVGQMDALLAA